MSAFGISPTDSTSSIEINDCIFCEHAKEVCEECNFDAREENDSFFGLDPSPRDAIDISGAYVKNAKDGSIECKKHKQSACNQCFGFKKQINKLHKDGMKNVKKAKKNDKGSNLFV